MEIFIGQMCHVLNRFGFFNSIKKKSEICWFAVTLSSIQTSIHLFFIISLAVFMWGMIDKSFIGLYREGLAFPILWNLHHKL